jgi:hypothetical protein
LRGQKNVSVAGLSGNMPAGSYGALSGYTRIIGASSDQGKDLTNTHPISITYNDAVASSDGELRRLTGEQKDVATTGAVIGIRGPAYRPLLPLEPTGKDGLGQVQCATCHDPHKNAEKFLRLNRRQVGTPSSANFSQSDDIICLACHDKLGKAWAESAHAKPSVANETYKGGAAKLRDTPGTPAVWEMACMNCHDTHTLSGARRLLREGVNGTWTNAVLGTDTVRYQPGTATRPRITVSAIENTCYLCHTNSTNSMLSTIPPNIEDEFKRNRRMPITTAEQTNALKEVHDVANADFLEADTNLGKGNVANRHVECTDCHNPHRVRQGAKFYDTSTGSSPRTHTVGGVEGNVASGVLRGTWGVEPSYNVAGSWPPDPTPYAMRSGDPGDSVSTARGSTYLTREYQLCFKCHSGYANTPGAFPELGNTGGGTPKTTNGTGLTRYTNVAAEFAAVSATDPPSALGTDQRDKTASVVNHRSWHPVMWPTGRTPDERGNASWNNLRKPYKLAEVGTLTMHCSDCHGSEVSWTQSPDLATTSTGGPNGNVQGPHGSNNDFILKGVWNDQVKPNNLSGSICGRCHDPAAATSGFSGSSEASHNWSAKKSRYCMACHIAVPHGWKNKAFLVNLNCVQSEASGYTATCGIAQGGSGDISGTNTFTNQPYYYKARLQIKTWARSGSWGESSCMGAGWDSGKDWMSSACGF